MVDFKELEAIIQELIKKYLSYRANNEEADKIRLAYETARKAHGNQLRKSKHLYIEHPLAVAKILVEIEMDWEVICAALLHDTVEDTNLSIDTIKDKFGVGIASLVEALTKIETEAKAHQKQYEQAEIESVRKIILGATEDLRVILIKLADRWDNLKSIEFLSRKRQKAIARESIAVYAPFANHLGLNFIKREIEDLSFKTLKPRDYIKYSQRISMAKRF